LPFHRRQADLVEPRYPRGDGVDQGTPDEFGGVRIRAAIADREQRARATDNAGALWLRANCSSDGVLSS